MKEQSSQRGIVLVSLETMLLKLGSRLKSGDIIS